MENGGYTPETLSDNVIDFNLMDEILFDGFWLETTNQSNFWQTGPSNSTALNPASFFFPSSETNLASLDTNPPQEPFLKETEKSDLFSYPQMDGFPGNQQHHHQPSAPSVSLVQSANFLLEETEVNRRVWVGPNRNGPIRPVSVKRKLVQAINYLKDSIRDSDVLVQIWVPVKREGKQVLSTTNQPFSYNPNCKNLAEYRDVSQNYHFAADLDSKELAGLPGRVFLKKLPEWTPDVRFFRREEYPRVNYAQRCDVRGSLALPVFETGSGNCLGVVEIVTTSQKLNYRPELENVCKALEVFAFFSSTLVSVANFSSSS